MAPRILLLLALALSLGFSACENEYPGETVGTFHVIGFLEENTCGAGVGAVNPLDFFVELRRDEETGEAIWRVPQQPIASGAYSDDDYRFEFHRSAAVYGADQLTGRAGCALDENDLVKVSVVPAQLADGGVPDSGTSAQDGGVSDGAILEGINVIELSPTPGSDCSLATSGPTGVFADLPCRVEYTLRGTPHHPI